MLIRLCADVHTDLNLRCIHMLTYNLCSTRTGSIYLISLYDYLIWLIESPFSKLLFGIHNKVQVGICL